MGGPGGGAPWNAGALGAQPPRRQAAATHLRARARILPPSLPSPAVLSPFTPRFNLESRHPHSLPSSNPAVLSPFTPRIPPSSAPSPLESFQPPSSLLPQSPSLPASRHCSLPQYIYAYKVLAHKHLQLFFAHDTITSSQRRPSVSSTWRKSQLKQHEGAS